MTIVTTNWRSSFTAALSMMFIHYSQKKGVLQNPAKRFCGFLKASKCVQSLRKRIKNSTEPSKGSEDYPLAEPSLTKPFFRFCTAKKGSVEKYETLRVQYKTINLWYETLMVSYQRANRTELFWFEFGSVRLNF